MDSTTYLMPKGAHALDPKQLDLRSDEEIDHDLLHPPPVTSEKNIWFFWHSGYSTMRPYTQRNIRAWYRRFSKRGWTIRVMDQEPDSPHNVACFLPIDDPETFPRAFIEGTITGTYARQHNSDLVRWPLLLKYGGVYADVGMLQIGDLDALWEATIGNPKSPYEVLSYNAGSTTEPSLTNYFLCCRRNNSLFSRCHKLLLALWASDGGRTCTDGMHAHPLLEGVPKLGKEGTEEHAKALTDYIIQGHAMNMVMGLVDIEDNWNGPEYTAKHVFAIEFMVGSQLINEMTNWDGNKAFELMSQRLPDAGETESETQKAAREIVEACLSRSFGFKLAHGLIIKVLGETLGSLWRKYEGSDDIPRTYAHWLRHGTMFWCPDELPKSVEFEVMEPYKRGPLLRER